MPRTVMQTPRRPLAKKKRNAAPAHREPVPGPVRQDGGLAVQGSHAAHGGDLPRGLFSHRSARLGTKKFLWIKSFSCVCCLEEGKKRRRKKKKKWSMCGCHA